MRTGVDKDKLLDPESLISEIASTIKELAEKAVKRSKVINDDDICEKYLINKCKHVQELEEKLWNANEALWKWRKGAYIVFSLIILGLILLAAIKIG